MGSIIKNSIIVHSDANLFNKSLNALIEEMQGQNLEVEINYSTSVNRGVIVYSAVILGRLK